jgi:epoxyqueuosine reductase QueG
MAGPGKEGFETMDEKQAVKEFALGLGVDDVGIASAADYRSPRSPELSSIFPGAGSLVVLAYKELATCESDNMQIAMNGRLDLMEFSRSCNYRLARFLDREFGARAMTVPVSYPLPMEVETQGAVADVSTRHAALAAGLGTFGRNNLVLHPRMGSRVIFTMVVSDLDLQSDPPVTERLCDDCMECVESCPGGALDEEGRTDVIKCLKVCQPYGIGGNIRFWMKYADATPEERKAMLVDVGYWRLYQAGSIGFQYFCFNCIKNCRVALE